MPSHRSQLQQISFSRHSPDFSFFQLKYIFVKEERPDIQVTAQPVEVDEIFKDQVPFEFAGVFDDRPRGRGVCNRLRPHVAGRTR